MVRWRSQVNLQQVCLMSAIYYFCRLFYQALLYFFHFHLISKIWQGCFSIYIQFTCILPLLFLSQTLSSFYFSYLFPILYFAMCFFLFSCYSFPSYFNCFLCVVFTTSYKLEGINSYHSSNEYQKIYINLFPLPS